MEKGAQAIYRTVALLKAIAARDRDGASMTELSQVTGLAGPTVHRIVQALVGLGLTVQLKNRRYVLGPLIYDLGLTASPRFDLLGLTREITDALAEKTEDTVFFSRVSGNEMVCVSRTSGSFPVKTLITDVGLRRPLGVGASGLAVLSALPREEALGIISNNAATLAEHGRSIEQVAEQIEVARKKGYVLRDILDLGARTISVPLKDHTGRPFGSFSVSSISHRMTGDHLDQCLALLQKAAADAQAKVSVNYSQHR